MLQPYTSPDAAQVSMTSCRINYQVYSAAAESNTSGAARPWATSLRRFSPARSHMSAWMASGNRTLTWQTDSLVYD